MLLCNFVVVVGLLSAASAYPSYSGLSKAILSSMTNLWNEQQERSPRSKMEADPLQWDYSYEAGSAGVSNEKPGDVSALEIIPDKVKNSDIEKSNYRVYSTRRTKYPQRGNSKKPSTYNVKSMKKDRGPLYRALYDSDPLSFERLLHFYDYLDESYEDTQQVVPNYTKYIEPMLDKFLKTITSIIERPVVVNTNICCRKTSPTLPPSYNLTQQQATTESALPASPYVGVAPNSRYASKHEDIVERLHRLLESIGHPRENHPKTQLNVSDKSQNVVDQSLPETTPTTAKTSLEVETIRDSESDFPASTFFDLPSTTPQSQKSVTPSAEGVSIETELSQELNYSSTTPPEEIVPESQRDLSSDTTVASDSFTEAVTDDDSPKLKRRKRQLLSKKRDNIVAESSIAQVVHPKGLATTLPPFQDIDYEDFVKNSLGNSAIGLGTLVLNRDPIVEHMNAPLLALEKRTQGEWKKPRKPSNCNETSAKTAQTDMVNIEEIIKNPPDFIEPIK